MRNFLTPLFCLAFLFAASQHPQTRFELSNGKESPTYPEIISWWKKMDLASGMVKVIEMGSTDAGLPLHLVLVSADNNFDIKTAKSKGKNIILVNNGIHPGEPDGIDASMLLVRDIHEKKFRLPSNIILAIIPVYNIGGALNRSINYRIDQNGPVEKGFRGNAQNLDLNRDFIKADSRNAFAFAKIFHYLDPDVFIDNHVSNGADYQHVMTLLTSQHNRVGGELGKYLEEKFEPALYAAMKQKGIDLLPYVNHYGDTPDKGWSQYWDGPRYSSGYASLWGTFAFVPETHMLKPYPQRVAATRSLMECFIEFTSKNGEEISRLRAASKAQNKTTNSFPLAWKPDRSKFKEVEFKGYESGRKPSEVSGQMRLFYDRTKPYTKNIPFYNVYNDTLRVEKPLAYILPQGWWKVIERLKANNIIMQPLVKDTTIEVEVYRILTYQAPRLYEGHYPNSRVTIAKTLKKIKFRKGDLYIPMNQNGNRFLVEVLEPQGEDSYFTWNFFDPILGAKEGFSDYVFEETAAAYLQTHPDLKAKLEEKRASDSTFAKSGAAQLDFVFKNSSYYEGSHMQYPVFRIVKNRK
jgi:hypothetical protein